MYNIINCKQPSINKIIIFFILLFLHFIVVAQQTTLLPGNEVGNQTASPQGGLRYQRAFYLITPNEIKAAGLANGMVINAIGFTLGSAQNQPSKGAFSVYLQNTSDTVGRVDTSWTNITTSTNSLSVPSGLFAGDYEWQVQSVCGSNSIFSPLTRFSNSNLTGCNIPSNLNTTNITSSSATFNWDAPAGVITKYYIEFKSFDTSLWSKDSTTNTFYTAAALSPGKIYQWRVKTACSSLSSDFLTTSFTTSNVVACAAPTSLLASNIIDTAATFSWTVAANASYYTLQYRRIGTLGYFSTTVFSNSVNIKANLVAGTIYEWQVKTICAAGSGAFISGTNFTTTGTAICYPPGNLSNGNLTDSSVTFKWDAVNGANSYLLRYRLKETISWNNVLNSAGGMTMVHNDSLVIPAKAGGYDISFVGGTPFTYSGNGVYVAWEYSQAASPLTTNNTTICTDVNTTIKNIYGVDSIKNFLSFVGRNDTAASGLQTLLNNSILRPETRFGSASLSDSVAVVSVYALGNAVPRFQAAASINALIANRTSSNKSFPVILIVKDQRTGTTRYRTTQNITVPPADSAIIQFTGWTPVLAENDSILISIPAQVGENVVNNNTNFYLQNNNAVTIGYDDGSQAISSAGFNKGAGLLLNKYNVSGCGKIIAAQVFLTSAAKNQPLYAVVLNAAGAIIAQSSVFTPDSSQTNLYRSFYFISPPSFFQQSFYIGLAQQSSVVGAKPVGTQFENSFRTGAYYRANIDGTNLIDSPQQGRLMINASIVSSAPEPFISGNLKICSGATDTLTAGSTNTRYANNVLGFSSQYASSSFSAVQVLGSPNVYPLYTSSPAAWLSSTTDGQREYLNLGFAEAAPINFIDVYETLNPGSIDTVYVKNPNTLNYDVVYTATASPAPQLARKNHISFPLTAYNVSEIRIALNSAAVPGYNAVDAVGIGQSILPASFNGYLWSPGGETTATKNITAAGVYKLTVTNASGCQSLDSINVTAAITTPPVITANRPITFCSGDSVVLSSNQASGNTWSTGATTKSITVKLAGNYTVSYNDGSGCGILTSSVVSVTVNALPVVSISGILAICPGSSTTLNAGTGFASYLWSNGLTTYSINVTSSGTYRVAVKNANGCTATASVNTTISPVPAPVITGNIQFCPGANTTLDAGANYSSYQWSTGAITRTIVVNTAATFSVTVTNASGCSGAASVGTSLLYIAPPSIVGGANLCPGGNITETISPAYAAYLWSNGATTPSINITSANTYGVTVTAANGCTSTVSKIIQQVAAPQPVISGTLSFCGGSSTTLSAGTGYNSYLWSDASTSNAILVTTAGTYSVTVTDVNGCTGAASATTTTQGSVPVTPSLITGNTGGVCNSSGNIYSISAVPNTSYYTWTVPSGAAIASGQSTTSITVNYLNTFTGGNIVVAASNACGQSPSNNPRILSVQGAAATPGLISGQVNGLCSQTAITYSIAAVNGASSYTWTVPANATISTGQGSTAVTINFTNNFTNGSICVRANSSCGNSANSCLAITGLPAAPLNITGATGVCSRQKNVPYSVAAVAGATSYTWGVPALASIVSGQGTNNIVVSFANKGGNISVTAANSCGAAATKTLAVTILGCTATASILSADVLLIPEQEIKIYPNPSKGLININLGSLSRDKYKLIVLDGSNRRVLQKDIYWEGNIISVDLQSLARGIYMIKLINADQEKIAKIILF